MSERNQLCGTGDEKQYDISILFRDIPVKFTWEGRNAKDFFYCRWGGNWFFLFWRVGEVNLNNLCWWGVQKWAVKCFTLWAVQINYSPNQWMNRIFLFFLNACAHQREVIIYFWKITLAHVGTKSTPRYWRRKTIWYFDSVHPLIRRIIYLYCPKGKTFHTVPRSWFRSDMGKSYLSEIDNYFPLMCACI
jgi:hypothetical protein